MKVAAVDLGTNSFLCLIAEVISGPNGHGAVAGPATSLQKIFDTCKVVRVGEKVHQNRFFLPEALKRAELCLDEFSRIIKKHKVDKVIATATSAARDAKNGDELLKLGRDRGIPISIIEGSKEAELSFDGAVSGVQGAAQKKIMVVDVGGGSTEIIFREPGGPMKNHSFDVGCVRLTEMFLKADPIDSGEYKKLSEYARDVMKSYGTVDPDLVIGVAGTPTTLACIEQEIDFDEDQVEGFNLNRKTINELAEKLGRMPLEMRKKVRGLEPLRADVIIAGCALLDCALGAARREQMRVSTRGLRYGVALHHEEFK